MDKESKRYYQYPEKYMNQSIKSIVEQFSLMVKEEFFPQSKVILFGSYAKGKQKKWSDIDVAVILPKINKILEAEKHLRIRSLEIDERISPLIFTTKNMRENSPLVWEIKQHGVEI